ncbi:inositol 1,4,5-trisphosphate receptor-interacting protein [Anguilla anguilla]|uniref:inositol 1,4,5-trisphosphate receptor-interacting protein n=1 Tax=Anguilla anguilla TaxID=7936 RepID=UPI0015AC6744|nr:inositol 1,4,5-trisphosphate receptor-interacting protein [Anguilla anguilla]
MMQAASFVTVVTAIFYHLSRVGYENNAPMTVQQEEGVQLAPSPKAQEVSRSERDFCPVYQQLPPGGQAQTYVRQSGLNSTHADGGPNGVGDVLLWLLVHFLWRWLRSPNSRDPARARAEDRVLAEGSVPVCPRALRLDDGGGGGGGGVLGGGFYERCVRGASQERWRALEFVEGFSDDLLGALRRTLGGEADLRVEDCVGVGSVYESWRAGEPLACDLLVPLAPPEPYRFSFRLWHGPGNGARPVRQASGRIRLEGPAGDEAGCLCATTGPEEDVLCLVHGPRATTNADVLESLLCSKDTPYLARDRVTKWFRTAVAKAWGQISHKYDFELTFRNPDSPGALRVRFRSGKTVVFNLTPVVRFEDSDAYFVSHFASDAGDRSPTSWPLSFAVYEKRLLKHLAERLPEDSCHLRCLQIVSFLHKKQVGLTGGTSLSVYHLKTALLHLLLDKRPSEWSATHLENRACDLLEFVREGLRKTELLHALIGNGRVPKEVGIPPVFRAAEPVDLFRPLAAQERLRAGAAEHFGEMLRNAALLMQEYALRWARG